MEARGAVAGASEPVALLKDFVRRAKGEDPLSPVTVITSSGYAAVFVRRLLSLGAGPGGRRGVANVDCTTLDGLIRSFGVPRLASQGLRPSTPTVGLEALRNEALDLGGWIARFADHPKALASLERALRELRRCPEGALDSISTHSAQSRALVLLLGRLRTRLVSCGFADELDVARAALAAAKDGGSPTEGVGSVIAWQLGRCPRPETEFLRHLAALEVPSDFQIRPRASSARGAEGDPLGIRLSEVVTCADPDEEARAAVRALVEATESGTPLWGQAIFHPPGGVYSRVLREHLDIAGVASNGPGSRSLDACAAARALSGLLSLAGGDWAREEVTAWLATAPIVCTSGGRPVPTSRWNAISAAAGVVKGLTQWQERLAHHAADHEHDAGESLALSEFVTGLAGRTQIRGGSWSDLAAWAKGLLRHYVDPARASSNSTWPEEEVAAHAQVVGLVESLGELDQISSSPDLTTFRHTLETALARTELETGELGTGGFGDGVFVAPYGAARGLVFERVVLCGLADAIVPGTGGTDALLGEEARAADTSGTLRTRSERRQELYEDLLCAIASGTAARVATLPRRDPRTGRTHLPSRWLGELVSVETLRREVKSFAAGTKGAGPAVSGPELALRALDRWVELGGLPAGSPVASRDRRLRAGFEAIGLRSSASFTRFDGSVGAGAVSPFDPDTPVSATRFETYAHCPRRYMFERALRVSRRVLPEELWRMEPVERGSLVHAILEEYVAERIGGAERSLDRLLEIANRFLDDAEAGGLVGKPLLWRMDRAAIVRELRRFHAEEGDLIPLSVELAFGGEGTDEDPPVTLALEDGRQVSFRGSADRVDRTRSGHLVVSDYKTGRQSGLSGLLRDPVAGGKLLQLPLYGIAARRRFGKDVTETVHARYWLLSSERSAPCYHLALTEAVEERFRKVVGTIASGVDEGCFPGIPGNSRFDGQFDNCTHCDFDPVCSPHRDRQWSRKMSDPKVAPVTSLLRDEVPEALAGTVVKGFVDLDEGAS